MNKEILLSRFEGPVFFNGARIDNNNDVMLESNKLYLSTELLMACYGMKIERSGYNDRYFFRRIEIDQNEMITSKEKYYFSFEVLEPFISYNKHFLKNDSELHMNDQIPKNIYYRDQWYELSKSSLYEYESNMQLIGVNDDGRGIYRAGTDSLWLEGNDGFLWEYCSPKWTLN